MFATREQGVHHEVHAALRRETLRGRTVVVAIDGGAARAAVTRIARQVEERYRAVPCVVRAFETTGVPRGGRVAAILDAGDAVLGELAQAARRREVRTELTSLLDDAAAWPVHVHPGSAAAVIVREAAEREAALVIMGLRRHGLVDRIVRDEATLNVVRSAGCAVLGIAPSHIGWFTCAVVGMDFTPPSIAAAQMTAQLLTPGAALLLVHVAPRSGDSEPAAAAARQAVTRRFDAVRAEITVGDLDVTDIVEPADGHVGIAAALLAVAGEYRADLLTVGSRRLPWIERTFEESVSTELVRDGRMSVLVVPPAPHPYAHELDNITEASQCAD